MKLTTRLVLAFVSPFILAVPAHAALTVTPITWNVIGLDSNSPTSGPKYFPVGARVCSDVATTNVAVNYVWDTANANVNLRSGSPSTLNIFSIGAGSCSDAYFEVEVNQVPAAYDTTRRYHITAQDGSGTYSSATPRELFVEHLISQNRNSITDVKFGPNIGSLTSVPAGGSMNLVVGNTYVVQLYGGTATQGYNQFEAFINFPNTIFQILSVSTQYSADNSPYVPNPNDKLYADACQWENDPNSPNYLACVGGDFKAGGSNVVTTYTIKVISGGGTSQSLTTLLYDFSGSSFHYNADFTTGARIANVIDPTASTISKSFNPNPASLNGVSALTITLTNPNGGALSGYNFVDNLPANLLVANPPSATTAGCGTPTLTATAGSSSISFSNGTLAANSNCVIKVNVTPTATGTLNNTTNNLFIDTLDTGHSASASLTVNNSPPPGTGICGVTFAKWTFPTGFSTTAPVPSTLNVASASANPGGGLTITSGTNSTTTADGTLSWASNGAVTTGATLVTTNDDYYEFGVDTTGISSISLTFDARYRGGNGPTGIAVFYSTAQKVAAAAETGTQLFNNATVLTTQNNWQTIGALNANSGLNSSGKTWFRIYTFNSGNTNAGSDSNIDNVNFTGCGTAIQPTLAKSFSPDPIAVNGVSTLTFTLTNTNTAALTSAAFSDSLPSGLQVAATPAASTTCAGATWAPAAAATTLTFSGGTIPASGSCTASVNVTATTSGPHTNVSGNLSTAESGTNTTNVASASLTALLPPSIAKQFAPNPILAGGTSTLTFTITNPNQNNSISGVAFSDTFPTSPGAMVVAGTPAATTGGCGAPTFAPVAGSGSISFSNGTIAAAGTCTVTVDITAPVTGTYNNTSGNVSHVINAATVNGNTASGSLTVNPPHPSIGLLKQVGLTPSGPWTNYLALSGGPVYYQFTVENTGDVPLSPISITDDTLNVSTCNAGWTSTTLPVAVAANDNHIVSCVVGPIPITPGAHPNTAHSTGTYSATPYNSPDSTATYATTGLTLAKSATESSFTNIGDVLHYSYLVTNSGFAPLEGPVTVADDKTTVTCPSVTTVGDLDNFLDPGESITCTATYTIAGVDITNAQVTNTATATVDGVSSNQSSKFVPYSASADVSLSKTLDTAGPFHIGDTIQYTLLVTNNGPSTATNIQVTDSPSNLTVTNVSGSGCAALPCTIASLANGANTSITVTATITAVGAFDNSATATGVQPDPVPGNNTDNTGNGGTAVASADVSLTKTLNTAGTYHVGDSIQYTITVHNVGPSTATNVQVTDTPTNLSITNVSSTNCSAFPCTIPSLANGADEIITVTATITATGAFDNSATATAAEFDPNNGNNTDNTGNGGTAVASADVSITKTLDTAGPFHAGDSIQYTLTVHNGGPSTATSVQVTDTPANLSITNVSGACVALPCTIGSIANGANVIITVTATITAAGAFDNSATATGVEDDPNLANNTDNTGNGGTAAASADVQLVKTLTSGGPFYIGDLVHYQVTVTNNGPSTATNVQVTDSPTNLSITTVSSTNCSAFPCTIPSLANGASEIITVTASITAVGAFDNSATATAAEFDPNSGNNTDNTGNNGTAAAQADVSIDKTLSTAGPYHAGDSIQYTLTVHNAGPSTATNVTVSDTPSNLSITNVSGGGCSLPLPCNIGSLANGADAIITVTATISAAGAFDNTASVTASEFDPNLTNNSDSSGNGGSAVAAADVVLTKSLSSGGPYTVGETLTYTIVVMNNGPSTATNIQVTDTPSNLNITNVSGSGCAAFPCTIASLANGANTMITVTATITAAGPFDNSATATAAEFDPNTGNNTDNTGNGGTAAAAADVSITKTLDTAGPFHVGDSIQYTLVVANGGPSTATNVQVTDTPTNLTITNVTGGGCAALPCTIASLANGANANIVVTATINAIGSFDNSATVSATESDPNSGNNTDSTGNGGSASASADVSIVKTLTTAGPYTAAQSIQYTLLVANAGPSTATNVQVTDTPTNLTITNVTGGGCSAFPCTIASLASGANVIITVTATITAEGAFDNSAAANGDEFDPDSSNNDDFTGNGGSAAPAADVSVVKSFVTAGPYTLGQSIQYTLLVANGGPSTATNIQVTDAPTNLTITNVSGGGCAALPCTIASLANGANVSITVTVTIDALTFDNSATVSAAESDPNTGNNTDNSGNAGTVGATADMSVVKTLVTAGPYHVGDSVTYTLLVANGGPSTATNVQVTDTPTNLTITNVTGGGCSALPCTIASLASGANVMITVTATIGTGGSFDNSATVSANEADSNLANNTDSSGNGGNDLASADVSIVKTLITSAPYTAGQSLSYSLLVANGGPSTATNVQVTDTPSNLTITNVTGGGCAALPCTIASLASGANVIISVTATIDATGAFDNSATATGAEFDPNTGNNTDSTGNGGTAGVTADISVVKTLTTSAPFNAGQSISYTLVVANAGPNTATNVQVTDTPTNLTITNVSGGGCAALPCTIASIASGANVMISVTATIVAAGAFDNSATVSAAESDPNLTDNTDSTGNGGTASSSADVSIVKTLTTSGPFTIGQSISYTLAVANAGPSTATNVQVTDTPTNLSITNVSGGGCAALPCTIASIANGANVMINVTAAITAAGAFDNSATATGTESDPNPGDNTDSTGNGGSAGSSADVSMVKTLTTAGPFTAGQSIAYTLTVANGGPSTATNVQVTDTATNLSITNVSGGGCAGLPCTIASIASGANVTINVTATITAAGAFDNSATATGTESDPNPGNNTDNTGNGGSAAPSADISVVKTLTTVGPFSLGQSVTYTLLVANGGPSTATTVHVTDTPSNLTITNVSGGGCAALPCTIASMANGANVTITVTATVNGSPFDNSSTVSASESDPNLTNNTDNSGNAGIVGVSADVSVVKTLTTAGPFTSGQSIAYTLLVANSGPSTATNVQVTDTPSNVTVTNVSGGGCAALPCTIASLASGANVTINVTATITATGAFDNTAVVSATEPDPNTANNTDSTGNGGTAGVPTQSVDVGIVKTASVAYARVGQTFDYTLVVTNHGPGTATGVTVTDPLPSAFALVSANSTQGSCGGTTTVTCNVGTMANGATVTIIVRGTITAAGMLQNTASVTINESDGVMSNNSSVAGLAVTADIPTVSDYGLMLLALLLGAAALMATRRG